MEMVESGKYALTHDGLSDGCRNIDLEEFMRARFPIDFRSF